MYVRTTPARSTSSRSTSSRRTSVSRRSNGPWKTSRSRSRFFKCIARRLDAGPDGGTDAHCRAHLAERRRSNRPRPPRALAKGRLEALLVGAQLGVALAHRREQVGHRFPNRLLEVAVAAAGELTLDLLRGDPARHREDVDEVRYARLVMAPH